MSLITISKLETLKRSLVKKSIFEFKIGGWLGRKFVSSNWAGFTLPLPFLVIVLYWVNNKTDTVDILVRVHETVHAWQDQQNLCFLVSWFKYIKEAIIERIKYGSWMNSYANNVYEKQAYQIEDEASRDNTIITKWMS